MKLIKFWKNNCEPCSKLATLLETEQRKYPDLEIVSVLASENLDMVLEYGVTTVPHVFLVDDFNIIVGSQKGVLGVPGFLDKHLNEDSA